MKNSDECPRISHYVFDFIYTRMSLRQDTSWRLSNTVLFSSTVYKLTLFTAAPVDLSRLSSRKCTDFRALDSTVWNSTPSRGEGESKHDSDPVLRLENLIWLRMIWVRSNEKKKERFRSLPSPTADENRCLLWFMHFCSLFCIKQISPLRNIFSPFYRRFAIMLQFTANITVAVRIVPQP